MKQLSRVAAATVVAFACASAPASAATPFTVGQGGGVHVVGSGDGTGHVAWGIPARDGAPAKIGYCNLAAFTNTCAFTQELAYPPAAPMTAEADPMDITIHSPSSPEVLITGSCKKCGDGSDSDHVYRWYSTTSGGSFSDPYLLGTTPTAAGIGANGHWLSGTNLFLAPGEGNKSLVFNTPMGGVAASFSVVSPGYTSTPGITLVPTLGGALYKIVYVAADSGSIQYSVFEGGTLDGGSVADESKWLKNRFLTLAEPNIGEPRLNTGPASAYLTYRRVVPGDNQILIRRFNAGVPNAFAAAAPLQGNDPIDDTADFPDSEQDGSGRVHVLWTSQYGGGRLRYTRSSATGDEYSAPANIAQGEAFVDPDVAGVPDGSGWAAWQGTGDSPIRVVRLEPSAEPVAVTPPVVKPPVVVPATPLTKTASVRGATVSFAVPRACVKAGATFKTTLTWKRKTQKGNLFVKITRTDFYVAGKLVKTDKTAPFSQTLRVPASAAAGSKLKLSARAHIKVKRGKSPKKSIASSVTVCP